MVFQGPVSGGEKESLKTALERHREVVLWKVQGLTDEQLRRPMTPSGITVLGIVKYLANLEYLWLCLPFGRAADAVSQKLMSQTAGADLRVAPNETTAEILTFYGRARAAADEVIDDVILDGRGRSHSGEDVTLRTALLHVVEEAARQVGHMDIVRELIDGQTGDRR